MATTPWAYPAAYAITGTTYIKDTDNNLTSAMGDLEDWVNSTGSYTTTGLAQSMVDVTNAQTIAGIKTFSAVPVFSAGITLGAVNVTATGTEINLLDGVTATTAELNILDGVTSTAAELNILDGVTSTAAELNILDGVTATATELNVLDGIAATLTAAELSILDGVTSTATELNLLDGVTATTAELNYVDGVTSAIQTQMDLKAPLDSPALTTTATLDGDTLLADSAKSLTANGYQTLSNGLIIQWGSMTSIAEATTAFSFPISFPTAVLSIYGSQDDVNTGTSSGNAIGTVATSLSAGTVEASGSGATVYWFAIGH